MIEGKTRKKEEGKLRKKEEGKRKFQHRRTSSDSRNVGVHFYFLLFTSYFLLFGISCSTQKAPLEVFKKLTGNWVESNGDSKFTETWTWKNDTLLIGSSLMTVGKDTAFSEKIQLVAQNDSIYYIPAVSNQNHGEIIRFGLISKKENEWIFENKKHDFPTQIIYTFKEKDSLIVVVKGSENGRKQEYTFRMQKLK